MYDHLSADSLTSHSTHWIKQFTYTILYNLYLSPLSKIPGPSKDLRTPIILLRNNRLSPHLDMAMSSTLRSITHSYPRTLIEHFTNSQRRKYFPIRTKRRPLQHAHSLSRDLWEQSQRPQNCTLLSCHSRSSTH